MLNRIYIIVGLLAIVVLAGAFIAPHFIRWSDYRGRMEELATSVLGTPVTVRGDIEFSLLPQPRLRFENVLVGSPEEPAATVDNVEAEFALTDFLRDNYSITKLVLHQPVIDFSIDESGLFSSGVSLATGSAGVGLGQTTVNGATIRVLDRRTNETFTIDKLSGDLRLSSIGGPISFQGNGVYRDEPFGMRLNSGATDAEGNSKVSLFVQPQTAGFTVSADGTFSPGMAPKFDGNIVYRQKPPAADNAGEIRGDLVLESRMTASTDRVVLSGYTMRPDENSASTRLTGVASIQLGARRSFDAVISGGVFNLPPRDAKEDASLQPYEIVRLLSELPPPIIPPMAGSVDIDLAEIGLRSFALRDLRVDATTDGKSWDVQQFIARLPGDTELRANGQLTREADKPAFRGQMSVNTKRLDALSVLWRRLEENTPLFNVPATLSGRIIFAGDALGLVSGVLNLRGQNHGLEIRAGFGEEKRLDIVTHFDALDATGSAIVGALLPNVTDGPGFANTFPVGSFAVTSKSGQVLGLTGIDLAAEGQWLPGQLRFSRLSAGELGGVSFNASLLAQGTLAEPDLSGSGKLSLARGDAPGLAALYDLLRVPSGWRNYLAPSAPADLQVVITDPLDGGQVVTLDGKLGVGDLNLRAELSGGLSNLTDAQVRVSGAVESTDIAGLTHQVGFGDSEIFSGEGSMLVSFGLDGIAKDGLNGRFRASLGSEYLGFEGQVALSEAGEIGGDGVLELSLADAGGVARIVGARNLTLPMAEGRAQVHFEGERLARLSAIEGTSGAVGFSGEVSLSRTGASTAVSGDVAIDLISVEGLATTLFGPAALVDGADVWPDGPIAQNMEERRTRGAVTVSAGALAAGGEARFGETSFELNWDETRLRLAKFTSALEDATLGLDLTVCCAGGLADRTVSGRISLTNMPLDSVMPSSLVDRLDGLIDGGARFEGTGASLAEVIASASGEGNFTLNSLSINQLSPQVYGTVEALDDVLTTDAASLATIMSMAVEQGPFTATTATGAFTIAGGVARLANFIVDGEGAGLAGSVNLALNSLGLNGSFVMTPQDAGDAQGLISADTARVIVRLAGSLLEPQMTLDLDEMVAAIQVRANEIEVDRLEQLRLEDAERQRATAEQRNRLIEEQRQRAAAEAARKAAEEEAARQAAEEARRLEEQRLQLQLLQQNSVPTTPTPVVPPNFTLPQAVPGSTQPGL